MSGIGYMQECLAHGSGLVTAVANMRAKFNIKCPVYIKKKITITVKGPDGELGEQKIEDIIAGERYKCQPGASEDGVLPIKETDTNILTGTIYIDYQMIKAGNFQVTYIPPVVGEYNVSVLWGGDHITSSPYIVQVTNEHGARPSTEELVTKSKRVSFSNGHDNSFDSKRKDDESSCNTPSVIAKSRRLSLCRQAHVSNNVRDLQESSSQGSSSLTSCSTKDSVDNTADVYRANALLSSSIGSTTSRGSIMSRSSSILSTAPERPSGVRRRRVIKRVIKCPGGREEVFYPSSTDYSSNRSSTLGSFSLSLSVSRDDRLSPYPSRSPSPSSAYLIPLPTLASLEREIIQYADRITQRVMSFAFYEISKNISSKMNQSKALVKDAEESFESNTTERRGYRRSATDETTSSGMDGLSIKTDSIVDDVFEDSMSFSNSTDATSSLRADSSDNYEVIRPLTFNLRQYNTTFRRPRHESESYFRPISCDSEDKNNNITKKRSQSDSYGSQNSEMFMTENQSEMLGLLCPVTVKPPLQTELCPDKGIPNGMKVAGEQPGSPTSSFVPVSSQRINVKNSNNAVKHSPNTIRRSFQRRRAKKRQVNKETQCNSEEIKQVTGWVNKRAIFQSNHHMKEVTSKDIFVSRDKSPVFSVNRFLGDDTSNDFRNTSNASPSSVNTSTNLDSNKITGKCEDPEVTTEDSKVTLTQQIQTLKDSSVNDNVETTTGDDDVGSGSPPLEGSINKRQAPVKSRSIVRQATFDSGFADENGNGHNGYIQIRTESSDESIPIISLIDRSHPEENDSRVLSSDPSANIATESLNKNSIQSIVFDICTDQQLNNLQSTMDATNEMPLMRSLNNAFPLQNNSRENQLMSPPYDNMTSRLKTNTPIHNSGAAESEESIENNIVFDLDKVENHEQFIISTFDEDHKDHQNYFHIADDIDANSESLFFQPWNLQLGNARNDDQNYLTSNGDVISKCETNNGFSEESFNLKLAEIKRSIEKSDSKGDEENEPSTILNLKTFSREEDFTESTKPQSCRAIGMGLQSGLVGIKNNFQVCTSDAGNGFLSVSVRGPRPHTVNECSVVYTGDDFYEVVYDVTLAGFYVISIKWAEQHITDSPFIVKVTF